jgi:RNA polymerase sigma factor (sigma-70 family)
MTTQDERLTFKVRCPGDDRHVGSDLEHLASRSIAGDSCAEEVLFRKLYDRFLLIARRTVREESVEDIALDACIKVLEKYQTEHFTISFEAWARGVLRNTIGNYLQKEKTRGIVMSMENEFARPIVQIRKELDCELKLNLLSALKKVIRTNRRYARILVLIYQGYKVNEICPRLNITPDHCYVILNRARAMLLEKIELGNALTRTNREVSRA